MKKSGVPFLFGIIFLVLFGVQGALITRASRCSCINTSQGKIHLKSLKELKQFAPTPYCEKTEIIATKKNREQICLNPDSTDVKKLVKMWEKQVNQNKELKKGRKPKKITKPKKRSKETSKSF